jgi:hypothetical protein
MHLRRPNVIGSSARELPGNEKSVTAGEKERELIMNAWKLREPNERESSRPEEKRLLDTSRKREHG